MKNRIETALKAFESPIRCGSPVLGLGSGVGSFGGSIFHSHSWSGPRPKFSCPKASKRIPQPAIRGEIVKKLLTAYKKTPLMQPTSGTVSYVTLQTSAPASTLSLPPTVDPPARCSRGQVQSTSPIHVTNSNLGSNLSIPGTR